MLSRPRLLGRFRGGRTAAVLGLLAVSIMLPSPAHAAEGSIDHVEPQPGVVRVLYSIPGIGTDIDPDLDSLTVTLDGEPLEADGSLAADAGGTIRRTAILAIDVSDSMQGARFEEAKQAAKAFVETAPVDMYLGIVAFAGEVEVPLEPTLDREAALSVIDDLTLSRNTRLYDGVLQSLETAGAEGQRNILVLSDGRDTSGTALSDVVTAVSDSKVRVDVVALAQLPQDEDLLEQIANSGGGRVLSADDPEALTALFASEAEALARQILITAEIPASVTATEGTLGVSVEASGEVYTDEAFVTVQQEAAPAPVKTRLQPVPDPRFTITNEQMLAGLGVAAAGVLVMLLGVFGVLERRKPPSVEERVAAYSRKSKNRKSAAAAAAAPQGVSAQAVGFAQRALETNKGLEASLGSRLEAAGMQMKPAEWLLAHVGFAFGAALLGLLLGSGSIVMALLMLFFGLVLPWVFLSFKKAQRLKAFGKGLADTLQLMSGSLSAGLSLAQSVDTVVREGVDPISSEFRRAIIEARLGVDIEDGLESIAERMQSEDFKWVVMAIRIQREVGGNLAELLLSVAATIREREYLRRHVKALSAEGRLSAVILGGLPPVFLLYLSLVQFEYVKPMFVTLLGWVMLGFMAGLMAVGVFWLSKTVKVDV